MDAYLYDESVRRWTNRHQNFTQRIDVLTNIWPPDLGDDDDPFEGLRATAKGFRTLIRRAMSNASTLHALGGGWSLSRVAATEGRLVNTKPVNWVFPLGGESVAPNFAGDPASLFLAHCGVQIGELSKELRVHGRSLRTSGASNGQTIVGAMSTGTHGSAFDVGAVQDYVVAIHLVAGPRKDVWLERESYPAVADDLVAALGTRRVADDTLFDAALVGLGGLGVVHAVVIETDPIFLLHAYRETVPFDDAFRRVIRTLDFDGLDLPGGDERPYHFEVVINPHSDVRPRVTTMYKRPYEPGYPPISESAYGVGDDALSVIGAITDHAHGAVPFVINTMFNKAYPLFPRDGDGPRIGTLAEIFSNTTTRGTASSCAVGVPLERANDVLDILLDLNRSEGPFPGLFAIRYVRRSPALLAFTRFAPVTAVFDLDAVQSRETKAFFSVACRALVSAGIPFTLHWGKENDFLTAARVRKMYGADRDRWIQARHKLLSPKMRATVENPFLRRCGLAE